VTNKGGADQVVKDVSGDQQTGTSAVRVAQSDPPTVGSSDHFDSVAQKRLPLGAELQLALNLIPAYTWYAVPSGALTFVNERGSDYGGLPKDHPIRLGIETGAAWDSHIPFLHPDDHEETRRVWSTCLRTGCAGQVSFRARNAEGRYRWFLSRAEPVRDSDGTLLYWIGINLDIEDQKQAEFYLGEGQRLAHVGSWAFNAAGFEYWSPELFRIHGIDTDGKAPTVEEYLKLVHPEDREFVEHQIQETLPTHRAFDFTKRIVRPNGEIRHVRCVGTAVTDGGTLGGFVGSGMDVTDQEQLTTDLRRSEHYLTEKERELRQILDLTPQQIGVLGPDGSPLYANRAALDYFGVSMEQWRAKSRIDLVHPDDREHFLGERKPRFLEGAPHEFEARMLGRDGRFRWFLFRLSPLKDDRGEITRWYGTATDIEARKQTEDRLQQENAALREEIDETSMFEEIVGTSPALQTVLSGISKVAPTESTVLITGETGTGKELVARAIHRRSGRTSRAFVSVNCAAIPRDLIPSELFGHEKGAFTGATQRRLGRFELADGGTIFLDEVGELSHDTQVAILRVLQEREFERVGGRQPIHVDVRVVAATNRDLKAAVASGIFRQDLFYRLNVFPIEVPPLRERKDDLLMLVEYFVQRYAKRTGKNIRSIDKKALALLRAYDWPGNIRELQNIIERAVILSSGGEFSVDESWLSKETLPAAIRIDAPVQSRSAVEPRTEREIIEAVLVETRGRVWGPTGAAAKLGIPPSTLDHRIKALGINKKQFKYPLTADQNHQNH
jgi:PAS domain S-box-containing protein